MSSQSSGEPVLETMQNALPNGRIGLALIVMDEKQGGLWFPELERCRVDQAAERADKAPLLRRPSQRLGNLASASDLHGRDPRAIAARSGNVWAMKRFVLSEAGQAWTLGSIGGLIVGFTHASVGATYLISFGLLAIGLGILLGPDRVRLWREMHGSSSTHHREGS